LRQWSTHREVLNAIRRQAWDEGERRFNWEFEKAKFLQVVDRVLTIRGHRAA